MERKKHYIAGIEKIIPKQYPASYVANKFYPEEKYGKKLNDLSQRLAHKFGVTNRSCVLDLEKYPLLTLENEKNHPLNWGISVIDKLTNIIDKEEIGFFSLSYNLSFHEDTLPNLATQIANSSGLLNLDKVEEISNYGCAASLYSVQNAIEYSKEYDRPAIVFTYDQCSKKCLQIDENDNDFKKLLITNLLFTDGGVGVIIIPERFKKKFHYH